MKYPACVISCLFALTSIAWGQGAIIQGGPWAAGHAPMYSSQGNAQAVVQDSGAARGGGYGAGFSELLLTMRGPGSPPYSAGTGPYGTNACDYDAPVTNPGGYHYFCYGPNATGAGVLAYGSVGPIGNLPFDFIINGTTYQFPFTVGGIVGPSTTTVGHLAVWGNTNGTLLGDEAQVTPAQLPAGVATNTLNTQTVNYHVAASDCGATVQMGTGSTGFLTITLPSASLFPPTCVLTVTNGDSARGKTLAGVPSNSPNILWPLQTITFAVVNGAWVAINPPGRWSLPGTVTCYIDAVNGNDNNDCLAPGSGNAVQTMFHAIEVISNRQWDLKAATSPQVIFQLADNLTCTGAFAYQGLHLAGPGVGHDGNATYLVQGNALTPSNVCVSDQTSQPAFAVFFGALLEIQNLKMQSASGIPTLQVDGGGAAVRLRGGIVFGGAGASSDIFVEDNGQVFADFGYTIAGPSAEHVITLDGGSFAVTGAPAITCSVSPAYSEFILAQRLARQYWAGATFSGCGSVTGYRYQAYGLSQIETGDAGANFFPGNVPGFLAGGSNYDGNSTFGVACSGTPTNSFTVTNGIVTHC